MSARIRFVVLAAALLLLAGCGQGYRGLDVEPVSGSTVTTTLAYLDGLDEGPAYTVTMNVPENWVGKFETQNLGNSVYFFYTEESAPARVFAVEALSPKQYWASSGSYPNSHTNIVNRGDTYFVYYLPIDAYYSGLDDTLFMTLTAEVPAIIASFAAVAAN